MGSKSAPSPDPRLGEAAIRSAQLGEEALNWYKQIYASDLKPMQDRQFNLQSGLIQDYLTDRQTQRDFANQQQAYYKRVFQPIEEQSARDAMNYDSAQNIARRQGIAGAAVTQAFSNARGIANRNLTRYGLNPNSGAFAATNARLTNAEALANAGARTGAAFDTMDKGIALRAGMANFGRNMPNTAAAYFGLANSTGGAASAMASQGMADARANAAMVGQGYGTALQGVGQAGNLWGQEFNGRMQGFQAEQQALGGMLQGIGGFAGYGMGAGWMRPSSSKEVKHDKREVKEGAALHGIRNLNVEGWKYKDDPEQETHVGPYAEDFKKEFGLGDGKTIHVVDALGVTMKAVQDLSDKVDAIEHKGVKKADGGIHKGPGKVKGKGGPVDDKVNARLSNGEYVLPADTVKKLGVKNLDRLVKETHTPAAKQRRGIRR